MKPVQACSICGGAIVGFGNDAWPVNGNRCCDQCNAKHVIPALRLWQGDATGERGNGTALQMIDLNDIEDDSFLAINATVGCTICGCNWPMKAGRSIVKLPRNEARQLSPGLQGAPQGVSQASDRTNCERERARQRVPAMDRRKLP